MVIGNRATRERPAMTPLQIHLSEEADLTEFDRPSRMRAIGNVLVAAQFTLLGLCALPLGPALPTAGIIRIIGIVVILAGLVVGAMGIASLGRSTRVHPVPASEATLRTTGIYAHIRHPMYLAVMLVAAGLTLAGGRLLALLATLALAAVLTAKARFEEDLLCEKFGWEYAAYCAKVPAVIPRPWHRW
jgi:protein-S-isoprenylcysteine O-methyltransferase Ste14